MPLYELLLTIATLLVGLIAGFFFTFSVIFMPGLRRLTNKDYIRSFQAVDSVLQNSLPAVSTAPIFGVVFFCAIFSLIASAALAIGIAGETDKILLVVAVLLYVFGMVLPTMRVHLPLNNKLQSLNVDTMSDEELAGARHNFEHVWVKWNVVRTVATILAFFILIVLCKNI
ncbi:MAG TPA: DUF1772 domain-containing protein [Verrucomicrobiae bacterium]|nr:DUF1772 domain-containing protein [Verrucomicrobiae bacterium]